MKKRPSIFTSIILTICILIAVPFNVSAAVGFNNVLQRNANTDSTDLTCVKLEGMAVGDKYIYIAKRSEDKQYVSIYRTKMATGETVLLKFSDNQNYTNKLGYAGDMKVIDIDGQTTLMVATGTSIVQVKVDNPNKQLTIQKVFKFDNIQYITSIASDKENSGVFYLRTKKADGDFSGFAIYKVSIGLSNKSSSKTISLSGNKICKLIKIADQCSGQGMAYYNGKLYLGMTNNENNTNCIGVYPLDKIKNGEVNVQNKITLKQEGEVEGVDITGGYLYYSQKTGASDTSFPYVVDKSSGTVK